VTKQKEHTAGSQSSSWWFIGSLAIVAGLQPLACGDNVEDPSLDGGQTTIDTPGGAAETVTTATMLADVGPMVIIPTLESYVNSAEGLIDSIEAWRDSSSSDQTDAKESAQERFADAVLAWQQVEMMQIGPAGSSLTAIAGADIRDEVYSWPTFDTCRVDQEVVEDVWDSDTFFDVNLVYSYGLDAVEHLLFSGVDNTCPSQVGIDQTWDSLGEEGLLLNRADYAITLIDKTIQHAEDLIDTWDPSEGNFSAELLNTETYPSQQEALNAVFVGLFYLETMTKDRKLGKPLGLRDCSEEICPEDVEYWASGQSLLAIHGNLLGFQALFTGGDGIGMSDLLEELGHGSVGTRMTENASVAIEVIESMNGDLDEIIINDYESAMTLYEAIKAITDDLKGDLTTILSLQIPKEASGDND